MKPKLAIIDKQLDCGCRLHVNVGRTRDRLTGMRVTWDDSAQVTVDRKCNGKHAEIMRAHSELLIASVEAEYQATQ